MLTAEKRYDEALAALERVTEAHLVRPGLFLQTADLYLRLRRWRDAEQVYEKALVIDPDNAHAHIGVYRMALRRRQFDKAAQAALDALQRIYHYPLAHFLLGLASAGKKECERAAEAFRAAISFNPNFPEAHVQLAASLKKHLNDAESAREHRRLARRMRSRGNARPVWRPAAEQSVASVSVPPNAPLTATTAEMPPSFIVNHDESLIVVTGLPRSGTSMLMQMLAAGGIGVLSDGLHGADEDNPRGYLEFEPVRNLVDDSNDSKGFRNNSNWLFAGRRKAVKIIAPLLAALPPDLACRVILSERDLDEVLDSQERMLARGNRSPVATPERRQMLKDEYVRILDRVKEMLARRPATQLMAIEYRKAISDPVATAEKVNGFLGGALDVAKMAAAIDPTLHRNRKDISGSRFEKTGLSLR